MLKFVIILIAAWLIGVFGWSQVVGSLQNLSVAKKYLFTLFLWLIILAAVAYFAIVKFDGLIPLLLGYVVSLFQVFKAGKIE